MPYEDKPLGNRETYFRIRQNWDMKGKKITIQFWDKAIKLVREKNQTILYRWNWKKAKYEKVDALLLNYLNQQKLYPRMF